jgi:uncharacterized membrane protein YczE
VSNLRQRVCGAPDGALSKLCKSLQTLRSVVSWHVVVLRSTISSGVNAGTLHQKIGLT